MQLPHIQAEIERMRLQARRQRKEIQTLQRSGIGTLPSEALLARMLVKIDDLCAQRAKLVGDARCGTGRSWPLLS
jgi:hypothetical protein